MRTRSRGKFLFALATGSLFITGAVRFLTTEPPHRSWNDRVLHEPVPAKSSVEQASKTSLSERRLAASWAPVSKTTKAVRAASSPPLVDRDAPSLATTSTGLRGRVFSPDGLPAAQALVELSRDPVPGSDAIAPSTMLMSTTTDAEGRYEFTSVPASLDLRVRAVSGNLLGQRRNLMTRTGVTARIDPIALRLGGLIEVQARSFSGDPVAEFSIQWISEDPPFDRGTMSASAGPLLFPPGRYRMTAHIPRGSSQEHLVDVSTDRLESIAFVMVPSLPGTESPVAISAEETVRVSAFDSNSGASIPLCAIRVWERSGGSAQHPRYRLRKTIEPEDSARGITQLRLPVDAGSESWILEGQATGFLPQQVSWRAGEFSADSGEVRFSMNRGNLLDLRVVDGDGSPFGGALVTIRDANPTTLLPPSTEINHAFTSPEGIVEFRGLPARVQVRIFADGWAPVVLRDLPLPQGKLREVALNPGSTLQGQVVNERREASRGEVVRCCDSWGECRETVSDEFGRFSFENLVPGSFSIAVGHKVSRDLEVGAGVSAPVLLTIPTPSPIRHGMVTVNGVPPSRGHVLFEGAEPGSSKSLPTASTSVGERGLFQIADLQPGLYQVTLLAPEGAIPGTPLEVVENDTSLRLAFETRVVSGRVSDPQVNPLSSASVELVPKSHRSGPGAVLRHRTSTNRSGHFVFEGVALIDFELRVHAAGYQPSRIPLPSTQSTSAMDVSLSPVGEAATHHQFTVAEEQHHRIPHLR